MAVASPAGEDCSLRDSWRIAASWASSFGCRGACGEDSMGCDCSVASWPVGPCVTEADGSRRDGPSSGCSLIAKVRLTGPEDRRTCRASRAFFPRGTLASCDLINCQGNHVRKCSLSSPRRNGSRPVSQSVSYFTVPPRAHPSTGSQSGSATPGVEHKYRVLAPGGYSLVASEVRLSQRTGCSLPLFALYC